MSQTNNEVCINEDMQRVLNGYRVIENTLSLRIKLIDKESDKVVGEYESIGHAIEDGVHELCMMQD